MLVVGVSWRNEVASCSELRILTTSHCGNVSENRPAIKSKYFVKFDPGGTVLTTQRRCHYQSNALSQQRTVLTT